MSRLHLVLGDQLSMSISSLSDYNPDSDVVLLCEVWNEATYVKHHKKKIAFLFSAMRHFAHHLTQAGYRVLYTTLDDPHNAGTFKGEVERALKCHKLDSVVVTHPGEYRVLADMRQWQETLGVAVDIRDDNRFFCSITSFEQWARGRKQPRMEYFYRDMRKQQGILMDEGKPIGGRWNFDAENRKPPREGLNIPAPLSSPVDAITRSVLTLVAQRFDDHFGDLEPFYFAVTREQALQVLRVFIEERLEYFGDYQDAMIEGEAWMYHSHISFYLNCGLLLPMECVHAAEAAFHQGRAPLNAVEGFIRQILGWREYVRGIYWLKMPGYAQLNQLKATRKLPAFYWTANTRMNCLKQCVKETKKNAYAHHIQRLMVLGNFALLAGIDPREVNEWFLIVYADAYEWVELPNVTGMILFADGGYLASKPYAAGGNYINKMSDYCKQCSYRVTQKSGPDACPFNYLYWGFLQRNRPLLQSNQRMAMMMKTLDRMDHSKQESIRSDNARFFLALDDDTFV